MEKRCESFLKENENNCERAFRKTLEDCKDQLPTVVNEIVCLPLRIDFICKVEDFLPIPSQPNVCDPSKVIDSKFGSEYVELKQFQEIFTAPFSNVSVNYTSQPGRSINEVGEKVNENLVYLRALVNVLCAFLVLVYFQVFYGESL